MNDLQKSYQQEAIDANTIGLSVPVALALKQLDTLREISLSLKALNEKLEKLLVLQVHPPVVAAALPRLASTPTKKDSRP